MKTLIPCIGVFLCFVGVLVAQDTARIQAAAQHFDLGSTNSRETVQIPLVIDTVVSRTADLSGFEIGPAPVVPQSVVSTFVPQPTMPAAVPYCVPVETSTVVADCSGPTSQATDDRGGRGILGRILGRRGRDGLFARRNERRGGI